MKLSRAAGRRAAPRDRLLYERHAEVCRVLSSPVRLEIIDRLRDGEQPVARLAARMRVAKATLSQHLGVMRGKGLVAVRRTGRQRHYRLAYPDMLRAYDLLRGILFARLASEGALARRMPRHGMKIS